MASIRSLATGKIYDGPDDAPIPAGYERIDAAASPAAPAVPVASATPAEPATAAPGRLERMASRGVDRAKEIATFPYRVGKLVAGVDKPQSFEDTALLALGNAPLIAAGGGALNLAANAVPRAAAAALPAVGRIATAVGLAKGRGEDNVNALWEGIGATGAEAGLGLANKALGGPAKALDVIRERIGKGADGPINLKLLDNLLEWWKHDPNKAVQSQRATTVVRNLLDMDPTKEAARVFREQVMQGTKIPNPMRQMRAPAVPPGLSQAARALLGAPETRGAVDAAMSADPKAGVIPAVAISQAPNPLHAISRMVMP